LPFSWNASVAIQLDGNHSIPSSMNPVKAEGFMSFYRFGAQGLGLIAGHLGLWSHLASMELSVGTPDVDRAGGPHSETALVGGRSQAVSGQLTFVAGGEKVQVSAWIPGGWKGHGVSVASYPAGDWGEIRPERMLRAFRGKDEFGLGMATQYGTTRIGLNVELSASAEWRQIWMDFEKDRNLQAHLRVTVQEEGGFTLGRDGLLSTLAADEVDLAHDTFFFETSAISDFFGLPAGSRTGIGVSKVPLSWDKVDPLRDPLGALNLVAGALRASIFPDREAPKGHDREHLEMAAPGLEDFQLPDASVRAK
jgi:hypothetical protein